MGIRFIDLGIFYGNIKNDSHNTEKQKLRYILKMSISCLPVTHEERKHSGHQYHDYNNHIV